jgi:hypothetical protein
VGIRSWTTGWPVAQRDVVSPGYLAEAAPVLTAPNDGFTIEIMRLAADVTIFRFGAPHTGAHSFDDPIPFQCGDGADDDDDGAAELATGVDLFAEADELDLLPVEINEHFQKVPSSTRIRSRRATIISSGAVVGSPFEVGETAGACRRRSRRGPSKLAASLSN